MTAFSNQAAAPRFRRSAFGWQNSISEQASHRRGWYSAAGVIRVVADDRESGSMVCERLAARAEVRLEVRRLEVGDCEVKGEWRFERKTVAGFGASLVDGWLLVYAARQVVRQREVVFVAVPRRARTLWRQRLRVLSAVPGVGPHRARLLLDHFGSIQAVVSAGLEELTDVRGNGSPTAGRIRKVVADVTVGVCSLVRSESPIDACNQALVL